MTLIEVKEFVEKCKKQNIKIPNDVLFICTDFEIQVPKDMHSHILVDYEDSSIISEEVINKFIKENAKL